MRITLLAGAEYVSTCTFLALYWHDGLVSGAVLLGFLAVSVLANLAFLLAIGSGATKRLKDPSITALQMAVSCGRDLLGMVLAPAVWFIFTLNLFVALPFGSLQFDKRAFALTWLGVSLSFAVVLALMPVNLSVPFDTVWHRVLFWALISAALARLMLFNARISALRDSLRKRVAELNVATSKLAEIATLDELTGLCNRREFNRRLLQECARSDRTGISAHLAIVDADHFKRVNDTHGHLVGDTTLKQLARVLAQTSRQGDVIARFGGEEFVFLLVGQDTGQVMCALERFRAAVEAHDWSKVAPGLALTVSVGVARRAHEESPESLVARADAALYAAKHLGRNRVTRAQEPAHGPGKSLVKST